MQTDKQLAVRVVCFKDLEGAARVYVCRLQFKF